MIPIDFKITKFSQYLLHIIIALDNYIAAMQFFDHVLLRSVRKTEMKKLAFIIFR